MPIHLGTMPAQRTPPPATHIRLEQLLGEGGRAAVWAARCSVSGRLEALKVPLNRALEPALRRQHENAAGLHHPNVMRHLGLTRLSDGMLAVRLERVAGARLGDVCCALEPDERIEVALGVCAGVAAIHGWGLVHGDLSPENVLVEGDTPRILDWGVDPEDGAGYGTPGYAALESLGGGLPSPTADVYALGCVLHEVLTGVPLWPDGMPGADPPLHPDLPRPVSELLAAMLSPRPEGRPVDAERVLHRLVAAFGRGSERLETLAYALLDDGRPACCEGPQARLREALDAVNGGQGCMVSVQVPGGADRRRLDAWLCDEAAARGATPVVVSNLTQLGRALGVSAAATRDPVHAISMALDAAASERPWMVVVPTSDADSPVLAPLHEALRTATRAGPVLAVVGDTSQADTTVTLKLLDLPRRKSFLAGFASELPAMVARVPAHTPEGARAILRVAFDLGALVRSDGRWVVDRTRSFDRSDPLIAAALNPRNTVALPYQPVERAVLAALWWSAGPLPESALPGLVGESAEAVEGALLTLMGNGLVTLEGAVALAHHQRARTAASTMGAYESAALHRRMANWHPPGWDFAERALNRALHELLADIAPDPATALDVSRALGSRGRRRVALALLDRLAPTHAVRAEKAELLVARGEFDRARALLDDCVPGDDQALLVRVARLLRRCGLHGRAKKLLDGTATTPAARLQLARACLWTGDLERADAIAQSLCAEPTPAVRAGAWQVRSTCAWQGGAPDEAQRFAIEGLEAAEGHRGLRADLLRALGLAGYYQGRHAEARDALAQATTENRALRRVPELAKCLNNLGMVDYARGEWGRAAQTWDEFRVLCARIGDPVELASACNNLGFLYARLGHGERAANEFRRCIQLAQGAGFSHLVPVARANLGEALMLGGALGEADAEFERAEAEFAAAQARHGRLELARRRAELRFRQGDAEGAGERARALLGDEGLAAEPNEFGHLQRLLAMCERALESHDAAVAAAEAALDHFGGGGDRFETAVSREVLAAALEARGDPFRAAHEVAAALDTYLALGARRHADRAAETHQALLEQTSSAARGVESRRALLDIAQRLGTALDLGQLAPLVLEKAVSIANAERGLFALVGSDGELQHVVLQNLEGSTDGALPISRGLVDRVLRGGETVAVQDVETEGDIGQRRSVRLLGLRSMVCVPVRRGPEVLGILYVDSSCRTLGDVRQDVEVLEAFASLVAACVDNARLFGEMRFRTHLLAKMAHDFRAPLSVVKANADVMRMSGIDDTDREEMVGEMEASAIRMTRMIDDTLELSRAEAALDAHVETIDLEDALARHLASLKVLARQYEVTLELKRSGVRPRLPTRVDRLWIVVDNLVFNALKFAPQDSRVTVAVRLREDAGPVGGTRDDGDVSEVFRHDDRLHPAPDACFVEVSVQNGGRPIPEAQKPRLFDAYHRGADGSVRGVKSTGLGLAIVAQCVQHLGGRVWVRSDAESGTTFSFTLPQRVLDSDVVALVT